MTLELTRLDLRLRRRMLIGTAVGAAAYLIVVVAAYPAFKDDTALSDLLRTNPGAAAAFGISGSITSPAGWLNANMYANFGPLLALLLTIGYGAVAIAGEAGDGLLGLTATQPVTRGTLLAQKVLALALVALVVPIVSYAVCLTGPHFELDPGWTDLAAVTLTTALLAFVPAVLIAQVLPISISGLGVRELLFTLFLHPLGVPRSQAVALGLLLYLLNLVVSLFGAPAFAVGHKAKVSVT